MPALAQVQSRETQVQSPGGADVHARLIRKNCHLGALLTVLAFAARAFAHPGEAPGPHDLARAWEFDPLVVIGLALSATLYLRGSRPLFTPPRAGHGIRRWEAACFWAGWASLAVALISPLHPLGEALFSAHMVQHEVLMLIAAPLLVLGRPLVAFVWGLPAPWRSPAGAAAKHPLIQRPWKLISAPLAAWMIHAAAIWLWHLPSWFDATLRSDWIHSLQHSSFLGSALLFWWALLRGRQGARYGAGVFYIFTTAVHTTALGALLTFAPAPWYPPYAGTTQAWGLTPLEDQQLGGLVMWVPAGVVYTLSGLALLAAWLHESRQRLDGSVLKSGRRAGVAAPDAAAPVRLAGR